MMGTGKRSLPRCYEYILGKDHAQWPPEARLMEAAHDGEVRAIKKIAKELDKHGHGIPATVANTTFRGVNALHAACGLGSLPVYRYLIEEVNMVEIDKPDIRGYTPVGHALAEGHLPAVRYLLDRGADLHQRRKDGTMSTLLHSAAAHGHSEIVKFLLSRGADIDAQSFFGTPLCLAALRGHASTVKILLQHNADPNKGTRRFGPLGMTLGISSVSCVKLLIQSGANVSGGSPCDIPLVAAAEKGLTEAIKCLLEAGANPNVPDTFGRLPIELAAEYGTREDVEILFPFTSPIPTVSNWSVDGIISHVENEIKQLEDDNFVKKRVSGLKQQADEAFRKQDYLNASVFYTQFGRLPIELAAEYGTREDIQILFPFTSPIPTVTNWSVDGIISHVEMEIKQLEDDNFVKKRVSDLKRQADEAFRKQDYLNASVFYTQALRMDKFDAQLLSNRSLCWVRMGHGEWAYDDADKCQELCPMWAKSHYRLGVALMCMKEYAGAHHSLSRALQLDPESQEIMKLLLEVIELK